MGRGFPRRQGADTSCDHRPRERQGGRRRCLCKHPPGARHDRGRWAQFSPRLQRRPAATEAMFLLMRRVFDELGYRRYEWKCDALNEPSRRAAKRLGFTFEGVFRQATMYRGRNRDTAWSSILDGEWPALKAAYERWLDPAGFDADGRQRTSLSALTREALGRDSTQALVTRG